MVEVVVTIVAARWSCERLRLSIYLAQIVSTAVAEKLFWRQGPKPADGGCVGGWAAPTAFPFSFSLFALRRDQQYPFSNAVCYDSNMATTQSASDIESCE